MSNVSVITSQSAPLETVALPQRVAALRPHLENKAPVPAIILARSPPQDGSPTYDLRIGTVDIPNVSLEEIFEYVSPYDLEVFENKTFRQEKAAERALEIAKKAAIRQARERKWLNRNLDSVSSGESSREQSLSFTSTTRDEKSVNPRQDGRRPRPTYTHLYKKGRARRGFKEPSDITSPDAPAFPARNARVIIPGESKREARRPSPEIPIVAIATYINVGTSSSSSSSSSDEDQTTKRRRLAGLSPTKIKVGKYHSRLISDSPKTSPKKPAGRSIIEAARGPPSEPTSPSSTSSLSDASPARIASGAANASPPPPTASSTLVARQSALATQSARKPPIIIDHDNGGDESSSENDDNDEDSTSETYEMEAILAHAMSDPLVQRPDLGKKSVRIYQVKWAGYDETTWEPLESFNDTSIVDDYWATVRAREKGGRGAKSRKEGIRSKPSSSTSTSLYTG